MMMKIQVIHVLPMSFNVNSIIKYCWSNRKNISTKEVKEDPVDIDNAISFRNVCTSPNIGWKVNKNKQSAHCWLTIEFLLPCLLFPVHLSTGVGMSTRTNLWVVYLPHMLTNIKVCYGTFVGRESFWCELYYFRYRVHNTALFQYR